MSDTQNLKVYLSFPIANASDGFEEIVFGIEKELEENFPVIVNNPLDNMNHPKLRTAEGIVKIVDDDIRMMDNSDVLLALYTTPSVGQSMEIFYFNRCCKPVYLLLDDTNWIRWHDAKFRLSAWLIYHTKKAFRIGNWKFAIREILNDNRK